MPSASPREWECKYIDKQYLEDIIAFINTNDIRPHEVLALRYSQSRWQLVYWHHLGN